MVELKKAAESTVVAATVQPSQNVVVSEVTQAQRAGHICHTTTQTSPKPMFGMLSDGSTDQELEYD